MILIFAFFGSIFIKTSWAIVNFHVFCPITDKDGNNTVAVKFSQCKTFACLWSSLTMDKIHRRTMMGYRNFSWQLKSTLRPLLERCVGCESVVSQSIRIPYPLSPSVSTNLKTRAPGRNAQVYPQIEKLQHPKAEIARGK